MSAFSISEKWYMHAGEWSRVVFIQSDIGRSLDGTAKTAKTSKPIRAGFLLRGGLRQTSLRAARGKALK